MLLFDPFWKGLGVADHPELMLRRGIDPGQADRQMGILRRRLSSQPPRCSTSYMYMT